jgi:hypothetical protein
VTFVVNGFQNYNSLFNMKNKLLIFCLLLTTLFTPSLLADEGMWIPLLIEKYNIRLMQEKGFKLSAEDIYSVNKACMKDAVVLFGGGCTGEVISPDGLMITNHHCGYGQIQKHSSLDHDYLTNGFWAMSKEEELPNPGLSVTFLKRMEDVTDKVLTGITDTTAGIRREKLLASNIEAIIKTATEGTGYSGMVRPFYMGKQYFLFVNEIFRDVRLVGAPPSAIGKFGGETDNWIWPRHTGDFSLFRIYADKDNKPADYSKANVPYKPIYHFPISLKGIKEGDFTMVFGYPGTTVEYVPSYHIDMVKNYINPGMIAIRTKKIDIMEAAMKTDPLIRIQYSAKKAGLANSWKKWIGENLGLEKMNTIGKKQEFEKRITEWINADQSRVARYGNVLPEYKVLYDSLRVYNFVNSYTNDVFFSGTAEVINFSLVMRSLAEMVKNNDDAGKIQAAKNSILESGRNFFRNYNQATDKKLFIAVMELYKDNLDIKWQVPEYIRLNNSCKGNFSAIADKLYKQSPFTDEVKFGKFVTEFSKKDVSTLNKDPFFQLASGATEFLSGNIRPELLKLIGTQQRLNRNYMNIQMEFDTNRTFYPDANLTLRLTYGTVQGYNPKDAVRYTCYTTLNGIIEKDNPEIYDYDVPAKLKELYKAKDYGRYVQDGEVPVCFIANNHTSGGNSGSPVINADGQLIGVNFDRAWEGVASDMSFNPALSRNISLDIRYALFIIDKFAGAGYLLKEMTIVE